MSAVPLGGYVQPGLDEDGLGRFPVYKRILFALGGPVANIATAFVGLFALGIVEFGLGAPDAMVFATSQVGITALQLASAVSALFVEPSQVSGIVALGGSQFG